MSKLEKVVFELYNIASDTAVITGAALLAAGNKSSGFYYLTAGILAEVISLVHESNMGYRTSDMYFWSRKKYSSIPPFSYVGKTE